MQRDVPSVDMRKVVDVPNETIASDGCRGNARIVEGLSPVCGATRQSGLKSNRLTKYCDTFPMLPPPSSGTSPSFLRSSSNPSLPAASSRSFSFHPPLGMSQRSIPVTSEMSMCANLPRKTDARNDETREMREVLA